ncbi:glycoside hydrolase family 5 protein [Flammeovirga sp. OC4]|uniref:glycoside hydrolase family 5 protein n=1 Tax=Flammeovirga sp. OC4 TaxID=1382345 RepID=UPI0009E338CA|nr:glycoside hydrolase family 5 protein [Flammeovirga sp. OC4]
MKHFKLLYFLKCIALASVLGAQVDLQAQVTDNGLLQVKGNKIVNKEGKPIRFAGPSLFWSNNYWGGEKFYNKNVVSWVKKDWHAGIIRAAMGAEDNGGYFEDPVSNKARVEAVVEAAIANDMYVIIDWHSHHANEHDWEKASTFFAEMAQKYGHHDNVLYEIYNEPLKISWSSKIKPYAESIIKTIRQYDSDNIIIVGTPTWSQDVDQAADDPIDQPNIAYTLHFYAGSHGQSLRDKGTYALSKGVALFVTEWGAVNANGDGEVNYEETKAWIDWMKANDISHCNWSINDKAEGASALYSGTSNKGGWSKLTASGTFVREIIKDYNSETGSHENKKERSTE